MNFETPTYDKPLVTEEMPETEMRPKKRSDLKRCCQLIFQVIAHDLPNDTSSVPYEIKAGEVSEDPLALEQYLASLGTRDAYVFNNTSDIDCFMRVLLEQWDAFEEDLWQRYYCHPFPFATVFLGHGNQHLRLLVQVNVDVYKLFIIPIPV